MIKRAPRPNQGFLILRNDVARDSRLSYRASGLLAEILSRPDNWTVSAEQLAAARPGGEGVKAVRTALTELEKAGYLKRERVRTADGRFGWVQTIYDTPTSDATDVSAGQTVSPKPPGGAPPDGYRPSTEEPRRRTEEEDVSDLSCTTSDRFAPSSGGDTEATELFGDQGSNGDEPPTVSTFADWRSEDREVFRQHVGELLQSDGSRWREGTFRADQFYDAFRKRKPKPIRWPGRLAESLYAANPDSGVEDWLADLGLEAA